MSDKHTNNIRFAIYSALLFCLLIIIDGASGLLTRLDNKWLDTLVVNHAKNNTPDKEIVVVDIDADSLHQLNSFAGPWPWPRSVHTTLIDLLNQQQPKAIVFDIFFNEPDAERTEADQGFINALSKIDNVFFPIYEKVNVDKNSGQLIRDLPPTLNFIKGKNADPNAKASLVMPDAIPSDLWKVGVVNETLDSDGVERRYNIYRTFSGWRLPALPTRLASYLGFPVPNQKEFIMDWQQANTTIYPTFPYSQVLVNLTQHVDYPAKNYFAGKIIVIGSSAINTQSNRHTPISSQQPSAQVLATAIDNLKNHSFLTSPLGAFANTFIALLSLILLAFIFINTKYHVIKTSLGLVVLSAFFVAISYVGVSSKTLIPVASKLMWLWLYVGINLAWQHGHNAIHYYRAHRLFSRALNTEVLRHLSAKPVSHPQDYAQKTTITALCCHLSSTSTLAETLDANAFIKLLNDYFDEQVAIIFKQHGTLDNLTADTLIAFWGAPIAAEKQGSIAVSTAMHMIDNIDSFKKKHHLPDLHISIGIHTGTATIGIMGSHQQLHYTAVGHTIDLAKAISTLANDKSVIIVSSDTKAACADDFKFIELGNHALLADKKSYLLFEPKRK